MIATVWRRHKENISKAALWMAIPSVTHLKLQETSVKVNCQPQKKMQE